MTVEMTIADFIDYCTKLEWEWRGRHNFHERRLLSSFGPRTQFYHDREFF
jgi:hypothetical protein